MTTEEKCTQIRGGVSQFNIPCSPRPWTDLPGISALWHDHTQTRSAPFKLRSHEIHFEVCMFSQFCVTCGAVAAGSTPSRLRLPPRRGAATRPRPPTLVFKIPTRILWCEHISFMKWPKNEWFFLVLLWILIHRVSNVDFYSPVSRHSSCLYIFYYAAPW